MKTLEYHHGGNWLDRLNNWLAVDPKDIGTWAIALDNQGLCFPNARSLFNNGYVSLRLTTPGIWLHVRVIPSRRSQFGIGWKLNGRFGITFRPWQTQVAAEAGASGPNVGQACGFDRGTA